MSTPIIELIAENIRTSVSGITVAAGYNQTLTGIRPKRANFMAECWKDLDVIIVQGVVSKLTTAMGYTTWRQMFSLMAIVINSDDETDSIDTRCNQVRSDIEKKVMADIRRNSLALDTECLGGEPFITDDGTMSGISIEISVDYRTKEDDPYSAA